ncbi:CRISPR-associated protein Cas2 [Desulfurococcus amylolyticus 1221n]|uniref:CRISPR-associated endoribonuclease Cas2 n=1 Tax=Desulfurococcus amylolyticus (strain DSM 18924 / JCM 16383 / VKM B-2413 / 1221n) TaxID=490899 RepID=B8D4S6_DESA1|nr:CRISPR-associated endonuclease Cas2 [Desulfurococcus amylolyticus]ACL11107.1 CRISPR-associated protein Cas2 [Desulfurococcus amylolyticus 1221n]
MYALVIYDVSSNEKRYNLANYLKTKGLTRIQRSAFIGRIPPSTLLDVERVIPKLIDGSIDVVHVFQLYDTAIQRLKVFGKPLAEITVEHGVMVIT